VTGNGRIAVIGGGVIGVAAAYYLARDGWQVTLVEKGDICAGSSHGNAGLIVPSHVIPLAAPGVWVKGLRWMLDPDSPFYIKPRLDRRLFSWLWRFRRACTEAHVRRSAPVLRDLTYASLALYRELAALDGLEIGFHQHGTLTVFLTEHGYAEAIGESRLLGRFGVPTKQLDGPAAREMEPSLTPEVVGAILSPDDAQVTPDRFVKGLAHVAETSGVRIMTATEVLGFTVTRPRIAGIETTRGHLEVDLVVLAAGAWSPGIARPLGLELPIQPAKGYGVNYRLPATGPRIPLLLGEAKAGVTPMGDTLRVAGTLELAGLDLSINRRRVAAIRRSAGRYVSGTDDMTLLEIWRGLRPCTPDGLPIVGRSARWENLILATGHAMIGVSLGPITGKLVAQIASGHTPTVGLSALSPERFSSSRAGDG